MHINDCNTNILYVWEYPITIYTELQKKWNSEVGTVISKQCHNLGPFSEVVFHCY